MALIIIHILLTDLVAQRDRKLDKMIQKLVKNKISTQVLNLLAAKYIIIIIIFLVYPLALEKSSHSVYDSCV